MNPLFAKNSLAILESLSFTKTLYVFDFDGTLSKIVKRPTDATISNKTDMLLKEFASLAAVAIVSGRSLEDLKQRLKFKPDLLVGNHGLEGLNLSSQSLDFANKVSQSWKEKLKRENFGPGIEVEDKTYSLAIHYRRSRQKKQAKIHIHEAIQTLDPTPRLIPGKCVLNLLPVGAPHKGYAVLELAKVVAAKHIFYIGDDDTDEDVFSLPDSNLMTVRVGDKKNSEAQYYIDRQSDVNRLLSLLIRFHKPKSNHFSLKMDRI